MSPPFLSSCGTRPGRGAFPADPKARAYLKLNRFQLLLGAVLLGRTLETGQADWKARQGETRMIPNILYCNSFLGKIRENLDLATMIATALIHPIHAANQGQNCLYK
jgi:hypothetical protein